MGKAKPSRRRVVILLSAPIVLLLLGNWSIPTVAKILADWDRWANDEYASIQIVETITETVTSSETIHLDNCDGKDIKEVWTGFRPILGYFYYEVNGTFHGDIVRKRLEEKYGPQPNLVSFRSFAALPGTNMEYIFARTEQRWMGVITTRSQPGESSYIAHKTISAETTSSRDLGCVL